MGIAALRRTLACATLALVALGIPSAGIGVSAGAAQVPDDPLFAGLWGLQKIDAPEAWDLNTGSRSIVVAVIDTGVAYGHPDLAPNLWANDDPPGGGDEDGNGKVDDTHGWDFVQDDATPLDYNGHGTQVAGTIGARGNNGLGVTGASWGVSIMPLRAGNAAGVFSPSAVAAAIAYACAEGAEVVNGSFALPGSDPALESAVTSPACAQTLFVFAAGDAAADLELTGAGHDSYPCELHRSPAAGGVFAANVLCVAGSDEGDALAPAASFGATAVHLAAPGSGIVSTLPGYTPLPGFPDGFDGQFAVRWGDRTVGEGSAEWDRVGPPFTLTDSPAGEYAPNSDTSIGRLSSFSTVGRSGCRLAYDLKLDTEEGADWLEIGAGPSPGPEAVDGHSGSTGGSFVPRTTDLSALDGLPSVFLRFRLLSGPTDHGDGAYLDNVSAECLDPAGGGYAARGDTSSGAAYVSGTAALLLSRNPSLTVAQLVAAIVGGVDPVPGLAGKVLTGGRLNAASALASVADGAPPETTITAGPPALSRSARALFRFEANEAATFECSLDAAAFAPCSSPHQLTGLVTGPHTFRVRAVDLAATTDPTPPSARGRSTARSRTRGSPPARPASPPPAAPSSASARPRPARRSSASSTDWSGRPAPHRRRTPASRAGRTPSACARSTRRGTWTHRRHRAAGGSASSRLTHASARPLRRLQARSGLRSPPASPFSSPATCSTGGRWTCRPCSARSRSSSSSASSSGRSTHSSPNSTTTPSSPAAMTGRRASASTSASCRSRRPASATSPRRRQSAVRSPCSRSSSASSTS